MISQLPILQIVVPLVAAPICVILRRRRPVMALTMVVCWAVFGIALTLMGQVLREGVIRYALGDWVAPYGIEYRIDTLNAFVLTFVAGIGAIVFTFAPASIEREIPPDRHYLFCVSYLLCLTGLLGIAITGDLFNLFVFLEISSLSSYALISLGPSRRSLTASFQYLILGTIGATFILIGVGLLYMMTGTLNMIDVAGRLGEVSSLRTARVALAFLSVGIALKMAMFPLHLWLPNAYTYAPSVVSAFLAATATKVSVYVLLRFIYTVFGQTFAFEVNRLDALLLPLALLGIFVASTVAIFQRNVKRMLAYSSVAQIGYMVLGISLATTTGLTAGIVHMFNHALMKGGLFLAMGCLAWGLGAVEIDDLAGAGRAMPWTMMAWVFGGLGLIGVPLTVGFVSKWYLIQAALERDRWWLAALVLSGSLLALVYVWRVVEVAYFHAPPPGRGKVSEAPLSMLIPTWILIGATLVFGVWTTFSVGVARRAAETLLVGLG